MIINEETLSGIVQQFVLEYEAGELSSLAVFLEKFPAEIAPKLKARCSAYLDGLAALRRHNPAQVPELKRVGRYRILAQRNAGGMACVYEALDESSQEHVAIKVLHEHLGGQLQARERFKRESRVALGLKHPHLARYREAGSDDGREYIVQDLYPQDLEQLLEKMPARSAQDIVRFAVEICAQVARALQYLHSKGLIHRDVKPANILMDAAGQAHLGDLGLARSGSKVEALTLTQEGQALGTPQYMSPEQFIARRRFIDQRTDIYSLGVVLYQLLTGALPFEGDSFAQIAFQVGVSTPRSPRFHDWSIPQSLEAICLKALERNPDHRFQQASELAEELERVLRLEATETRLPRFWVRQWRMIKSRPSQWGSISFVGVIIICALAWIWWQKRATFEHRLAPLQRFLEAQQQASLAELFFVGQQAKLVEQEYGSRAYAWTRPVAERLQEIGEREVLLALAPAPKGLGESAGQVQDHAPRSAAMILNSLTRAREAARLLPSGHALRKEVGLGHVLPQLSIPSGAAGEELDYWIIEVDEQRGGYRENALRRGQTPARIPLPPGHYRVLLRDSVGRFAELTRTLIQWGRIYQASAPLLDSALVVAKMVPIAAGPFSGWIDRRSQDKQQVISLPDFYIDDSEVSFADYRVFLQESGRPAPPSWPIPYDQSWDFFAVVDVLQADAIAYAEWAGKRLPTRSEWNRAAMGPSWSAYPWASAGTPAEFGMRFEADWNWPPGAAAKLAHYRLWARPLRSVLVDQRLENGVPLFDFLAGVSEWIDGVSSGSNAGQSVINFGLGQAKGGNPWWETTLQTIMEVPLEDEAPRRAPPIYGFRCAKSAAVPF